MFYIVFLGIFSFVLLVDYFPRNNNGGKRNGFTNIGVPITEIHIHVGMLSVVVEEIIEVSLNIFCNVPFNLNIVFFSLVYIMLKRVHITAVQLFGIISLMTDGIFLI